MDPLLDEDLEASQRSERIQKTIGGVLILTALATVCALPFLPSSKKPSSYDICGKAGVSSASVDRAMEIMIESDATDEQKLAAFLQTFTNSRNAGRLRACGEAILRDVHVAQANATE